MIRAAVIRPFEEVVEIVEVDPNDWPAVQRLVSGGTFDVYLESLTLPGGILLVDEHGKLKNEPPNEIATRLVMPVYGDFIVGNAVLFGPPVKEELSSITPIWIERLLTVGAVIKENQ